MVISKFARVAIRQLADGRLRVKYARVAKLADALP